MTDTIEINRIEYLVEKRITPEIALREGMTATANILIENHLDAHLYIRRPKGTKIYFTTEMTYRGMKLYGKPVSLG